MAGTSINLHTKAKAQGFSARFVCLTGKTVKGDMHPIRLQLIHNLKVKRFSTGEACTVKEWDADTGRMKPRAKNAANVNRTLNAMEAEVGSIVDALVVNGALSFDAFEARYRKPKAAGDVLAFMDEVVGDLEKAGKVGNAATYRNTARILRRYLGWRRVKVPDEKAGFRWEWKGGKVFPFADLTAAKLEKLEQHLRDEGCTGGGISVYMRTLRAVVGKAMKAGMMHPDQYPFETGTRAGYSMKGLKSERNPRALTEADMDKLKSFPFDEAPHLAQSVRLFTFSYYARGMNFVDMAHLKPENIVDGRIEYRREKTKRKGRDAEFSVKVSEPLAEILAAFDGQEGPYLFPILGEAHATDKQKWNRIRKCLKAVNADLKEAAEVVGIRTNLTTYVARHTFATTWKRKGASVEMISEAMGHSSVQVTTGYLGRFHSEVLDKADAML
jgi:integrase